jgi:hypothetical protein
VQGIAYRVNNQPTEHIDVLVLATKVAGLAHKVGGFVATVRCPFRLHTTGHSARAPIASCQLSHMQHDNSTDSSSGVHVIPSTKALNLLLQLLSLVTRHAIQYHRNATEWLRVIVLHAILF